MIQFTRHDPNEPGGTHETMTLVRRDRDGTLAVQVETGTPATWSRDPNDRTFVGLFDLDGDAIRVGNEAWLIVENTIFRDKDVRALSAATEIKFASPMTRGDVEAALMNAWETGTSVCEVAS